MRQFNHSYFACIPVSVRSFAELTRGFPLACRSFRFLFLLSVITFLPGSMLHADNLTPKVLDSSGQTRFISKPETVREIFFMRLNAWPNGSPIHVFVLPDNHPLHIRFAKEILGVYPFQLRSAWDRLVYSGTGVAPTTVDTPEEMLTLIKNTPGSIGYIGESGDSR